MNINLFRSGKNFYADDIPLIIVIHDNVFCNFVGIVNMILFEANVNSVGVLWCILISITLFNIFLYFIGHVDGDKSQ